ncbi:hypothetical protein HMPREF9700_01785 [Bergeyella zoohelcum CCUG 30536]|uniref:Uncharacterized protein n=1 Tax=Bergeyella zoohelcum TaxID=1015 RepID=A0A380ZV37_9FLAO|nr:hypothetical protein HMPREF9700_01785 [Bergeyella zoohelcum CCUG 30536]SUV53211.1 Uncharacterised protein [Bergeyella zoohelcum]
MTVHEGLGNTLIELNSKGYNKIHQKLTPNFIKSLNKIQK